MPTKMRVGTWDIYNEGICMVCNETTDVRHINLYVRGSEGLHCCPACEDKILEFVHRIMREAAITRKNEFKKEKEMRNAGPLMKISIWLRWYWYKKTMWRKHDTSLSK